MSWCFRKEHGIEEKVVNPKFTTDFPEAVLREGPNEQTLRAEEEGTLHTFIGTTDVETADGGPPLVDEDWHAVCQAMLQIVEGSEWKTVYYNLKELHQAAKNRFLRSGQCAED